MATKKPLIKFLTVRVKPSVYKAFSARATKHGGVSVLLRELVDAYMDNRLTISAPSNHKDLYVS